MLTYKVSEMSCGHCVKAITNAIHEVDVTAKVDIDLQTKIVNVETSQDHLLIENAIKEAGYEPEN